MAITRITLTHSNPLDALIDQGDKYQVANSLINLFAGMAGGAYAGNSLDLQIAEGDATAASATVTFADEGTANDTILINGVTFTAVAAGATGNQWDVGADEVESAENLAAAIAASATALVNEHVTATADDTGVVTVTAISKGDSGNAITIAEGVDFASSMTVSGARLSGGSNATANTFSFV